MMHHKIIGRAARKRSFNIAKPFLNEMGINSIGNYNLFAQHDVTVVCHAVFTDVVLPFKQIDIVIVYAYILDSFGYLHGYLRSPMVETALLTADDLIAMSALPMDSF